MLVSLDTFVYAYRSALVTQNSIRGQATNLRKIMSVNKLIAQNTFCGTFPLLSSQNCRKKSKINEIQSNLRISLRDMSIDKCIFEALLSSQKFLSNETPYSEIV